MKPMSDATSRSEAGESFELSPSYRSAASSTRDGDLQRASGAVRVEFAGFEGANRLVDVFQRAPLRALFPKAGSGAIEEIVLANTAGGIAGGDRLDTSITASANASFAVTSQAAEKVYRALHEPARIRTALRAAHGARLAWLPQETILFNGARLVRTTEIELAPASELIALEWLVLGRSAHGEEMLTGEIIDRWRVRRDGRLVWADSFRIAPEVFRHIRRAPLLADSRALATLVYFGPDIDSRSECIRDVLKGLHVRCGATCVAGLMILRFASPYSSELRLALTSFLQQSNLEFSSGPFRVPKMWSC